MKTQTHPTPLTPADRLKDVIQYAEIKRLADNILLHQRLKEFRSLAVLSLFPEEGKTFLTAALAMAYADASQSRVLVVDTATRRSPRALVLRHCVPASDPMIDYLSLEEFRQETNGNGHGNGNGHATAIPVGIERRPEELAMNADVVHTAPINMLVKRESDQVLLRKLAVERGTEYGLIVMDTAPLTARNKGNLDPMVVARLSDASVLVVNPHLYRGSALESQIKLLKDPALHLMGIISNEEFFI